VKGAPHRGWRATMLRYRKTSPFAESIGKSEAERRFGDEDIAPDGLEWLTRRIVFRLVIT
jgi:hypothetical protein